MRTLLVFAGLLAALTCSAQRSRSVETPVYSGGTNSVPNLSTNDYFFIDAPRGEQLYFFCSYSFHAVGAGDATSISLEVFAGTDRVNFTTVPMFTWAVTGNGTTPVALGTVFTNGAAPYLRGRFKNTSTNAVATNLVFSYSFKN